MIPSLAKRRSSFSGAVATTAARACLPFSARRPKHSRAKPRASDQPRRRGRFRGPGAWRAMRRQAGSGRLQLIDETGEPYRWPAVPRERARGQKTPTGTRRRSSIASRACRHASARFSARRGARSWRNAMHLATSAHRRSPAGLAQARLRQRRLKSAGPVLPGGSLVIFFPAPQFNRDTPPCAKDRHGGCRASPSAGVKFTSRLGRSRPRPGSRCRQLTPQLAYLRRDLLSRHPGRSRPTDISSASARNTRRSYPAFPKRDGSSTAERQVGATKAPTPGALINLRQTLSTRAIFSISRWSLVNSFHNAIRAASIAPITVSKMACPVVGSRIRASKRPRLTSSTFNPHPRGIPRMLSSTSRSLPCKSLRPTTRARVSLQGADFA